MTQLRPAAINAMWTAMDIGDCCMWWTDWKTGNTMVLWCPGSRDLH